MIAAVYTTICTIGEFLDKRAIVKNEEVNNVVLDNRVHQASEDAVAISTLAS